MNKTVTVTIPVEVLLAIFGAELVAYFITRALHHVPPMVLYTYDQLLIDSASKYTSHGCYPKYWLCKDGGILSYEALKENLNQIKDAMTGESDPQWEVIGCDVNWENEDLVCSHTGKKIEAAYV